MALSEIDEAREFNPRMAQMQADTTLNMVPTQKVEQDWRLDPQRVVIQAVLATAAIVGAVAGVLGFFIGRGH